MTVSQAKALFTASEPITPGWITPTDVLLMIDYLEDDWLSRDTINLGLLQGEQTQAHATTLASAKSYTDAQVSPKANTTTVNASLALKANLASPTFTGTVTVPTATVSGAAVNKGQLDLKQTAPTNGTAMLTWASCQTSNPVTVWGVAQNTTNTPSGGANIQLQWIPNEASINPTVRMHIDYRAGYTGHTYIDMARGHAVRMPNAANSGYKINTAVMTYVGHDLSMWFFSNEVILGIDTTQWGNLAFKAPSALKYKMVVPGPQYSDFSGVVSEIPVKSFEYKANAGGLWSGGMHFGLIAEDVAEALTSRTLPDGAVVRSDTGEVEGLNQADLIGILWGAVQELTARVAVLEAV